MTATAPKHRTKKPTTTPELLADAAADAQDPEQCDRRRCWASRSQLARPHQLERLQAETSVLWLDPAGQRLEWVRESFVSRRPRGPHVRAITVDAAGRCCRAFTATARDLEAYRRLRATGHGTCPVEAVWPASIKPGQPAMPAHAWLAAADAA